MSAMNECMYTVHVCMQNVSFMCPYFRMCLYVHCTMYVITFSIRSNWQSHSKITLHICVVAINDYKFKKVELNSWHPAWPLASIPLRQ